MIRTVKKANIHPDSPIDKAKRMRERNAVNMGYQKEIVNDTLMMVEDLFRETQKLAQRVSALEKNQLTPA